MAAFHCVLTSIQESVPTLRMLQHQLYKQLKGKVPTLTILWHTGCIILFRLIKNSGHAKEAFHEFIPLNSSFECSSMA